jgi:hypothetical protein
VRPGATWRAVLGPLPRGLPAFEIPWINQADIVPVLIGGFASPWSFADTSVLYQPMRACAISQPNQEMVDWVANLALDLFRASISGSSSRTPVAERRALALS